MLKVDVPRCYELFVAVDGLQHRCDELRGHGKWQRHYCVIHNVLEK